ncbi:E4 SUMO-protein ligase PIAL1 isoform X1 [Cornus florida]|uniref:E4 SUMO-protein ligase PIAL1 isoform X1 n=2 Tax=Cornus florida TaxID=4283 RepID=UPI0028970564|nr:E4 SUMO-protein ligase PIAL1 isoform X1 [Cornus florida]
MAGPAITPAPISDKSTGRPLTPSLVNTFRIFAVVERLAMYVRGMLKKDDVEFFNLCLSLARGIDYAVANNEVPGKVQDLPFMLKQVCQRKNDSLLQAAIMVLMISVKNACKIGWFSDKDSKELLSLANEIGSSFCSARDFSTEASSSLPTISKILSRFYPQMKIGQILASLEAKPGYGTFVIDFHISKNTNFSPEEKIRLFVAQLDNIETSACLISPPRVNFLLNGKGVHRRNNVFMDSGPQTPTIVSPMLKYGTNLLQAVGQFNGNYIIVVAFMSVISNLDRPVLQDYVQPAVAAVDSDFEIIEGPSRISLNCPISFRRINTPVKGHSCKHLQCFDFDNFVDINTRRPSWRCPHCNQYVCYTDIRVDQNMVKVLREVEKNVADVIIAADGSWKAVTESNDQKDLPHDRPSDGPALQKSTSFSDAVPDILDLTEETDEMDVMGTCETEDRKPVLANVLCQTNSKNLTVPAEFNNPSEISQNNASHVEDDFWSGIYLSTSGSGIPDASSVAQIFGGVSGSLPTTSMLSPVLTDAVSPALNREAGALHGSTLLDTSVSQSQIPSSSNLHLQQTNFGNAFSANEYGRFPSIPRHVNRTPIAVQALPAPTLTPVSQQRSRNNLNTLNPNGMSLPSQTSRALPTIAEVFDAVSSDVERQQQFSRSHLNPLQMSNMTSSLQQPSATQNWDQPVVGLKASNPLPSAYRAHNSSSQQQQQQSSQQLQPLNLRMSHSTSQSPSMIQSSALFRQTQVRQGSAQSGVGNAAGTGISQQARFMNATALRAAQVARRSPSMPVPMQTPRTSSFPVNVDGGFKASVGEQRGNTGGMVQPTTREDSMVDLAAAEQNWRPTGRMRGSLSGSAYSAALNQFIIRPTQPTQAARPPSIITSPPPGIPPEFHVLMANRSAHTSPAANQPLTQSSSSAGGSGVLPERSSGMY